jgi:hypothetical protein
MDCGLDAGRQQLPVGLGRAPIERADKEIDHQYGRNQAHQRRDVDIARQLTVE